MTKTRTILLAAVVALVALVAAAPAVAGGWALVKLDEVPSGVAAGERLTVGFTVLQHGRTPAGMEVLQEPPVLTATNADEPSSTAVTATARPAGARGHYVVDVTFPVAGSWRWQVRPGWFEATELTPLAVGPAAGPAPAPQPAAAAGDDGGVRPLTIAGGLLLLAASVLVITALRRPRTRPVATVAGPTLTPER